MIYLLNYVVFVNKCTVNLPRRDCTKFLDFVLIYFVNSCDGRSTTQCCMTSVCRLPFLFYLSFLCQNH
jgi:hypothetical protein